MSLVRGLRRWPSQALAPAPKMNWSTWWNDGGATNHSNSSWTDWWKLRNLGLGFCEDKGRYVYTRKPLTPWQPLFHETPFASGQTEEELLVQAVKKPNHLRQLLPFSVEKDAPTPMPGSTTISTTLTSTTGQEEGCGDYEDIIQRKVAMNGWIVRIPFPLIPLTKQQDQSLFDKNKDKAPASSSSSSWSWKNARPLQQCIGLYLHMSMVNHSCEPNTFFFRGRLYAASRAIRAGEELTTCYVCPDHLVGLHPTERSRLLKRWFQRCHCQACLDGRIIPRQVADDFYSHSLATLSNSMDSMDGKSCHHLQEEEEVDQQAMTSKENDGLAPPMTKVVEYLH